MKIKISMIVGYTLNFNGELSVEELTKVYPEMGLNVVRVAAAEEPDYVETVAHDGVFALIATNATEGEVCILSGIVKGIVHARLMARHERNVAKYGCLLTAGTITIEQFGAYEGAKIAEKYVPETHAELIHDDGELTFLLYAPKDWTLEDIKRITMQRILAHGSNLN